MSASALPTGGPISLDTPAFACLSRVRAVVSAVRALPNLDLAEPTEKTAVAAARLRTQHHLRMPDAVHVATGIESRAAWFVTSDRRLLRVEREGIRVWLFGEHTGEG